MFPCHQAAWLIAPGKVLRKKLQDFSVGHAFLLEAMESPFIVGGNIGFDDLVVAALLCSLPFRKANRFLLLPPSLISKKVMRWGWICRMFGFDLSVEAKKMQDYVSAYMEMPEVWQEKNKPGKKSAMPFTIRLVWCLMTKMTEDEAWNCPMSRALAYYSAEAEHNGTEFVSEEQKKIIEA